MARTTEGTATPAPNLAFTVDTHLLRELGALLVGRDSTALVELIKNAYDADATSVTVYGERLRDHGLISVRDDGHGMTHTDFERKFLRIAGRSKEVGDRRSPRYERKFTGAKGIGRLSAHKLGQTLALESTPDLSVLNRSEGDDGFSADINWTAIESSSTSIENTREISVSSGPAVESNVGAGTLLTIQELHSQWTPQLLNQFLAEVRSTRADATLTNPLPDGAFEGPSLIPRINVADTGPDDPGFSIELTGDFDGSEPQWPTLLSHVSWMLEIDARLAESVSYRVTPSKSLVSKRPESAAQTFASKRADGGPRFVARIFIRDGWSTPGSALPDLLSRFATEAAGVRLFFEGFRVLPYGTPRNDWLGLGAASSRRTALEFLEEVDIHGPDPAVNEKTYQLSNASYFGAVFLHDKDSAGLEMVVNREGFLPGADMESLTEIVKRGINISTRLRAALGAQQNAEEFELKRLERESRHRELLDGPEPANSAHQKRGPSPKQNRLSDWVRAGEEAAASLRRSGPRPADDPSAAQNVAVVSAALEEIRAAAEETASEQAQLRVLASLGTQVGAFVHEINGVLGQSRAVRNVLVDLSKEHAADSELARRLRVARDAQVELVSSLERQAVYLSDSLGAEARRRRVRGSVQDRWATAVRLLGGSAERRKVQLVDNLPSELKTPPIFPAEMNVIFTNLLSNAIKAAGNPTGEVPREVRVSGESVDGTLSVLVENTGATVDVADSEQWFRPFTTTTSEIDSALGQGLGLGLTLTRRIIEEYGGGIRFVKPSADMATAVSFWLPGAR